MRIRLPGASPGKGPPKPARARLDHATCTVYQTELERQQTRLHSGLGFPGPAGARFRPPPPSPSGTGRAAPGAGTPVARAAQGTRCGARAGTGTGRRRAARRTEGRGGETPQAPPAGAARGQGRATRRPLTSLPDSRGNGCGRWWCWPRSWEPRPREGDLRAWRRW